MFPGRVDGVFMPYQCTLCAALDRIFLSSLSVFFRTCRPKYLTLLIYALLNKYQCLKFTGIKGETLPGFEVDVIVQ